MRGCGVAVLLSGIALSLPQASTAETSLAVAQLRTCRSQSDTAKRLACYDSLGAEPCRYENDPVARLACYDAIVVAASPHR